MHPDERKLFDKLFDEVVAQLPAEIYGLFQEMPVIVEDHPSDAVMSELGIDHVDELAGLHTGVPITERTFEGGEPAPTPEAIYLFREGIIALSLDDDGYINNTELVRQMRITLLHEVGHHFGLTEEDLERLGYQ